MTDALEIPYQTLIPIKGGMRPSIDQDIVEIPGNILSGLRAFIKERKQWYLNWLNSARGHELGEGKCFDAVVRLSSDNGHIMFLPITVNAGWKKVATEWTAGTVDELEVNPIPEQLRSLKNQDAGIPTT